MENHMYSDFEIENFKAGKKFEEMFAHQYRLTGRKLVRLSDESQNKPPCDFFSVYPGCAVFLELKSTGRPELPMIDLRPHQVTSMYCYDGACPGMHAGFVIQFRSDRGNAVYYLSGKDMHQYAMDVCRGTDNTCLRGHVLDNDYLLEHGIYIPAYKATPKARTTSALDIESFLRELQLAR